MAKDKYKNPYTGDLFGVEDCHCCNGTGQVEQETIDGDAEYIDDCDACNGTGEKHG
jgi:DnaJ-class molecular chaperone